MPETSWIAVSYGAGSSLVKSRSVVPAVRLWTSWMICWQAVPSRLPGTRPSSRRLSGSTAVGSQSSPRRRSSGSSWSAPQELVHLKWESPGTLCHGGTHEVTRLLRDFDRDLAQGLTVSDVCRKAGIAATTSYRWRRRPDPARVDAARRCRERDAEVERLKRRVAELMRDQPRLQDIANKTWSAPTNSGPRPTTWARITGSRNGGPPGSGGATGRP
jgi:putative transposase